jgi:hypothetical protein
MTPLRRLTAPVLACLAVVAVPSAAAAKELTAAKVCGAGGCSTFHDAATLRGLSEGGPSAPAPERAARFFTVKLTVKVEDASESSWTVAYVPSAGLLRTRDGGTYSWLETTPAGAHALARVTRGLRPFPARRLRGAGAESPAAQVDEVVLPPARPAAAAPDGGSFPWVVVALIVAAGGGLAAGAVRLHGRSGGRLGGRVARS